MLTENTVNKLYEMRLTTMAKAFKDQMTDPNMSKMPFEDRLGLLVDQEWLSRRNNHLDRLIKQAKFAESGACTEDIDYHLRMAIITGQKGRNFRPVRAIIDGQINT